MPVDDVSNETSQNGENAAVVAAARLQHEADQMRRPPLFAKKGVRDITQDFISASQHLPQDHLIKDEYFTLFEAVGALEIMDPKMDSGCIPAGDSFEPDFDVCGSLDATEVLWIMDELLRLETSFQDGYPVSQNIFTSLHIARLIHPDNNYPYRFHFEGFDGGPDPSVEQQLVHVVLRAYCVAVIKSTHLILNTIQSHTFFEEEDFVTYLFGRELLPRINSQQAHDILVEAVEWIQHSQLSLQIREALKQRLLVRLDLLYSMDDGDEGSWIGLRTRIKEMDQHHAIAKPLTEAFSDKVQRQLATSTPPRPMPKLSWQDACQKWSELCEDVLAIFGLTSLAIRESPHCLQRAAWAFAYRNPPPSTFTRAKMQEVLTRDDCVAGDVPHFDLMLMDIRDLVLAGDPLADIESFQIEMPSDPRHKASRLIEDFMQRAFPEYLDFYRAVCQNRCRMRRTFTQVVPRLDEMESDARDVDRQLNEIIIPRRVQTDDGHWAQLDPLTFWVRNHKLQVMEWIIQLGFETDLYLPREMSSMYMTLQEIAHSRQMHLQHIQTFIASRSEALRRSRNTEYEEQCRASKVWVKNLIAQSAVVWHLSKALAEIYALLERLNIIDTSSMPYEEDALRYEARMKPLLGLVHDQMPTLEFFNNQKNVTNIECSQATASVKDAKMRLAELKAMSSTDAKYTGTEEQWKKEIKSLEFVCVAMSVAISQLQRICRNYEDSTDPQCVNFRNLVEVVIPASGMRYHDWWVVPQVREKT